MGIPLTLTACIESALENNPSLKVAGSEVDTARAEREMAAGERWPKLDVKGGAASYLDSQRLLPASYNGEKGIFSRDIFDLGVVLRLPLFTGGRLINTVKAAKLTESAFSDRFARTRQELIFNVTSAFYTILGRRRQLDSISFSRDVLKKDRQRIEAFIQAKKAARADLLRIEVRLAQVEQSWVRIRNEIQIAWRVLYNLMGVRTEFGAQVPPIEGDLRPMPPIPDAKSAYENALEKRPDYLAAIARVEAQSRRVDAACGERWPQINLEGTYGYRIANDPSDHPDDTDAAGDRGAIGLTMEIPVFEGGRIQARVRRELAKLSGLREALISLQLNIQKDVETAMNNISSARQRVKTQDSALIQAREALHIEQEKYRLGKGTILDVLDAQRAMLELETEYYRALAEYHIAIGQFRLATGDLQ